MYRNILLNKSLANNLEFFNYLNNIVDNKLED